MIHPFVQVQVFEGVAERTGVSADKESLRGQKSVCSSIRDLMRKSRRMGDGIYYLPTEVWPENEERITLTQEWKTMG